MNLQEMDRDSMDWMDLGQDRVVRQAVVNVVTNLQVP